MWQHGGLTPAPTGAVWVAGRAGAFGISRAEKPWKVRLLFAGEVATHVGERLSHPSQPMRRCRDGTLEVALETSSRKELTRWILSWVPYVRVLAPGDLRERGKARLREALAGP